MTSQVPDPVYWPEGDLLERRAIFVYEVARMQALAVGAPVVPEPWPRRDSKFRSQFLNVVKMMMGEERKSSPEELHDDWVKAYEAMGWTYGPERNVVLRTHPDMVPFDELDPRERDKDAVFVALCELARQWVIEYPEPPAACVFEYHIRGQTNNAYCETHQMWRDIDEDSFEPNPEHEAAKAGEQA